MNALAALIRKDLVLHFSNRRAVLMSIVAPILIAAFFGSLFGGHDATPAGIPLGITDQDHSALSARVLAGLRTDSALTLTEASAADAAAGVDAGKLRAAIVLPAGFGAQAVRALFTGRARPEIGLRYDPSQGMVLPMVRGLLAQHAMEGVWQSWIDDGPAQVAGMRRDALASVGPDDPRRADLAAMFDSIDKYTTDAKAAPGKDGPAARSAAFGVPFTTHEVEAGPQPDRKYNSYAHAFAGMGVQFILLMGVDMAVGLLALRRLGLWKRLRAAPLSRARLLGSRIASTALIALIVFGVIYAVAMAAFGVRIEGSIAGFVAVLVAFALLTASFGLLVAALGKTPEATRGLAILATLLLVMLGGAWVPSFVFPSWLQKVSLLAPTRWAIDGLDAMTWRGLPFEASLVPIAVMLGCSALFAALALWRFRWEEE